MGPGRRGGARLITVANRSRRPVDRRRLERTVATALSALGVPDHEVSVTLVDDRTIRALNARYRGVRKNVFDLRRCAVVHNLHVLMHLPQTEQQAA